PSRLLRHVVRRLDRRAGIGRVLVEFLPQRVADLVGVDLVDLVGGDRRSAADVFLGGRLRRRRRLGLLAPPGQRAAAAGSGEQEMTHHLSSREARLAFRSADLAQGAGWPIDLAALSRSLSRSSSGLPPGRLAIRWL